LLASKFVDGFSIDNFWWALLFSIILSIITSAIDKKRKRGSAGFQIGSPDLHIINHPQRPFLLIVFLTN
jgi:hypothetical protein